MQVAAAKGTAPGAEQLIAMPAIGPAPPPHPPPTGVPMGPGTVPTLTAVPAVLPPGYPMPLPFPTGVPPTAPPAPQLLDTAPVPPWRTGLPPPAPQQLDAMPAPPWRIGAAPAGPPVKPGPPTASTHKASGAHEPSSEGHRSLDEAASKAASEAESLQRALQRLRDDQASEAEKSNKTVAVFVQENRLDLSAENALRALPPEAQQKVIAEGPIMGNNPSAVLMARARKATGGP